MKCPNCGYVQHAKPSHRPKKFKAEEEKQIVEDAKKMKAAKKMKKSQSIIVNLSGRGDKDLESVNEFLNKNRLNQ